MFGASAQGFGANMIQDRRTMFTGVVHARLGRVYAVTQYGADLLRTGRQEHAPRAVLLARIDHGEFPQAHPLFKAARHCGDGILTVDVDKVAKGGEQRSVGHHLRRYAGFLAFVPGCQNETKSLHALLILRVKLNWCCH